VIERKRARWYSSEMRVLLLSNEYKKMKKVGKGKEDN
jgi:hypothetical protein